MAVAVLAMAGSGVCAEGVPNTRSSLTILTINYPPLAYFDRGQLTGYGTDIVQAVLQRTGDAGIMEVGAFSDALARVRSRPDTALFPLSRVPAREKDFQWVGPLLSEEINLYARQGSGIILPDLDAVRHVRSIATVGGYASHRHLEKLGFSNLVPHDGPTQCAESLAQGRVDLWLCSGAVMASLALQAGVDPTEFEKVFTLEEFPAYLAFSLSTPAGVVQRWQDALREMDADGTLGRIRSQWQQRLDEGVGPKLSSGGVLSLDERARDWIRKAYPLRTGVLTDREPLDYMVQGRHAGLAADLLASLSGRIGLRFQPVPMPTEARIREALRKGEIDLAAGLPPRPGDGLLYTDAYAEYPHVIVVRRGGPSIVWLDELSGRLVSVARDSLAAQMLPSAVKGAMIEQFDTEGDALKAVSAGRAFAYVGSYSSVGYLLRKLQLSDLRVSGHTGLELHRVSMAVRTDLPILHDILQHSLRSLGSDERRRLMSMSIVEVDTGGDEDVASHVQVGVAVSAVCAVLAALGAWIALLKRELAVCRRSEDELSQIETQRGLLLRSARVGVFTADARTGRLLEADKAMAAMLGHDDLAVVTDQIRLPSIAGARDYGDASEGKSPDDGFRDMCVSLRHAGGHNIWVRLSGYASEDGSLVRGVAQDITELMRAQEDLLRMDEEWRVVLDAIPFHVGLQGTDRRFSKVNAAGERLLGMPRDRIVGSHVADVVPDEVWKLLKPAEDRALSGKVAEMDVQTDYARRDGCYRAYYSPHMDAFGMIHGFVSCLIDVTDRRRAERALADSEERYRLTVEQAHDAIVIASLEGTILYGNSSAQMLFGINLQEAKGMSILRFVHEEDRDMIASFLGKQGAFTYGVRMLDRDGRTLYVENSRSVIQYGGSPAILVHIRDVTDRKQAMDNLRENEQRLQLALDSMEYGMWEMWLDKETVLLPQRVLCDNFGHEQRDGGYTFEEVASLVHQEDLGRVRESFREYLAGGSDTLRYEFRVRDSDDAWRWVQIFGRAVEFGENGEPVRLLGMIQDITGRKRTEAKLRELATTDPLTGLDNRRSFMDQALREFRRSMRYGSQLSLLMLDLDRFKMVNDTFGHDVGDEVLCALADAMRGALRDVDTLGRLGGEEFAVLLPQTGIDMAASAAERLREWVGGTAVIADDGTEVRCTVSIGVVEAVEGEELKDFLSRADKAMYEAKRKGRNRVETHPDR